MLVSDMDLVDGVETIAIDELSMGQTLTCRCHILCPQILRIYVATLT